jgi:cytochrome c551/c552
MSQIPISAVLHIRHCIYTNASHTDIAAHYTANAGKAKKLVKLVTEGEHKSDAALNPAELATWTMMANHMMNLDEVLNK